MPNERKSPLDNSCLTSEYLKLNLYIAGELAKIEEHRKEMEKERKEIGKILADAQARHDLMGIQRELSPKKSMRACMTTPITRLNAGAVMPITMQISQHGYSVSGLGMCKNGFCVMCSRMKSKERAENIMAGLERIAGKKYFVTLTIPRQSDIKTARKEIQRRWQRVQNRLEYVTDSNFEFCKALDITFSYTKETYHLHLHVIAILPHGVDPSCISETWIRANDDISAQEQCQKIETVKTKSKLSKYVAKMCGLALEISCNYSKTQTKTKESITLAKLMQDAGAGDKRAIKIYQNFLCAMSRCKTITFSEKWKSKIKETAEEPAPEDEKKHILYIPITWWRVVKNKIIHIGEKLFYAYKKNTEIPIAALQDIMDGLVDAKYLDDWLCGEY